MKKKTAILLLLSLLIAIVNAQAESSPAGDADIGHRVLLTAQADSYSVYQIVSFEEATHILKSVTIITRFTAESGVTEEIVGNYNIEDAYPNTREMDFVSHEIYTVDDCVNFAMRFDDLDVAENKKMMVDNGYLLLTDASETLTSDKYVSSLNNYGAVKEVPRVDYERLGFHF